MNDYPKLTSSPVTPSQSWIVDNIRSIIASSQEDDMANTHDTSNLSLSGCEDNNSNNVTLTSTSLQNHMGDDGQQQANEAIKLPTAGFLNDERFKNVTLRPPSYYDNTNHSSYLKWKDIYKQNPHTLSHGDVERQRGFSRNTELQNEMSYSIKRSVLTEDAERQQKQQKQDVDPSYSYLLDRHNQPKLDEGLNEHFSLKFLQSRCDLLHNSDQIGIEDDLNVPTKANQFYFDELDSENKMNSYGIPALSLDKSSSDMLKSTSTNSLSSVYSSEDVSYDEMRSSTSSLGYGSSYQLSLMAQMSTLNQNASAFNPASKSHLTTSSTNSINKRDTSGNMSNSVSNQMIQSYSDFVFKRKVSDEFADSQLKGNTNGLFNL